MESQEPQNDLRANINPNKLSRRDFLKSAGVGGAALVLNYFASRAPDIKSSLEETSGVPNVHLMFFSETHKETPAGTERFREMFDKADVFVSEIGPWDAKLLEWFRNRENIAKMEGGWGVVGQSKKPIFFVDPPKEDPVWEKHDEIGLGFKPDYSLSFDKAVAKQKKFLIEDVEVHKYRERVWEKQLSNILKRLRSSGVFRGRPAINIMVRAGAYHTDIYHKLAKKSDDNITTERIFSEDPIIYPYKYEAMRRLLLKGQSPTLEIMTKVMVEAMLNDVLGPKFGEKFKDSPDYSSESKYVRRITDSFTNEDARAVFNQLSVIERKKDLLDEDIIHKQQSEWLSDFISKKGFSLR